MIPLGDASRRPYNFPITTSVLILANAVFFWLELTRGDAFINRWVLVFGALANRFFRVRRRPQ